MGTADNGVLRIGDWRVDPALDEISRAGTTVKLEPRAMRVLVCLAGHAGQVVSVDQLLDAVWKDVVVTPDSVYQAVAGLRRALGDDSKEHAYIANVLRRGYRLVAPVSPWAESSGESVPPPAPASAEPAAPQQRWRWVVLGSVLILGIAAAAVWKFQAAKPPAPAAKKPAATVTSVAVLPFVDMSRDKDQAYFADGLTEEISTRLAKIHGLQVPATTSSFYFKDRKLRVAEIARALGVAYVLEGSVRKSGDTLRITAQLVRGDGEDQLWSDTFDRPLTDIFNVQDEIAGAVVQVLKLSLIEHYRPERVPTANIEAYTLYMRATSAITKAGAADYSTAAMQLKSALALDPGFASAWASLALVEIWTFDYRGAPTEAACGRAKSAAERALKLDATLAVSHQATAQVLQACDQNLPAAEAQLTTALEIAPGSAGTLRAYAWLAQAAGRLDQALKLAQRAVIADPLNPWSHAVLGDVQMSARRFEQAEMSYRRAVEIEPEAASLHAILANILLANHKPAEAVEMAEQETDPEFRGLVMPLALDAAGRTGDADRAIAAVELQYGDAAADTIAEFYACRHDTERAIRWLTVWAANSKGVFNDLPNRIECLKNLASDPRFQALKGRIALPESRN